MTEEVWKSNDEIVGFRVPDNGAAGTDAGPARTPGCASFTILLEGGRPYPPRRRSA